jgi:hypothetical protein
MRGYLAIASALFLASCQTDDRAARLKPHIGRTMADFSRDTGLVPNNSYDIAGGRVFLVNGPTIAVAISPGIVASGGCRMLIETIATNPRGTADDWRITSITANGPC